MIKNEKYKIEGMTCAACQARVEKAVSNLDGITSCSVSLLTNSMVVDHDESLKPSDIEKAVKRSGYKAKLTRSEKSSFEEKNEQPKKLLVILILSFIFLIPLFYLSAGYMSGWYIFNLDKYPVDLITIELVLASIILGLNIRFFISGTKAIFHGGPNMDTLVALGSGIAYIYSIVIYVMMLINKDNANKVMELSMNISFETTGMVLTLITIGKLLEAISKGRTTTAIKSLLKLRPNIAHKKVDDKIVDINSNNLILNDIFVVKPGELFPADGIIIDGYSSVNEASLTGEAIPIDKKINDIVKTGTINLDGFLTVKATAVGSDTTINKIVKMVEMASSTKTKISRLADKISLFFVPSIILIGLFTFTIWMIVGKDFVTSHNLNVSLLSYSITRAISVLVISCPCALGLATPVAIMVASGKGARNGILYKNATTLEETGKVDIVVFDKTGTLTKGEPRVDKVFANEIELNRLIEYAASLEEKSNHPIARAIVKHRDNLSLNIVEVIDYKENIGVGVEGKIDGHHITIVKPNFVKENNLNNPFKKETKQLEKDCTTFVFLLIDERIKGLISLKDEIKEDAPKLIDYLKRIGITTLLLSGDNEASSSLVAEELKVDQVIANVLPDQKYLVIKELQKQGKVMMVGDGINDSIALTQADIGVAIAKGSDIAIESADIVLSKDSLIDIYGAIILSRKTLLNIKENLIWAFFYNILMIPIAAGAYSMLGLYKITPWMSSLAMSLSSISVVLNALRLNLINIYKRKKQSKLRIEYNQIELNKNEESIMKVYVEGMMCMHCVAHVKSALESIDGIKNVEVSLEKGLATFVLTKEVSDEKIKTAISDSGYKVIKIQR